ncbi:MAG: transposase [Bacteroidales bacterium]|nr:transposase [Bacteroidales bacterium]
MNRFGQILQHAEYQAVTKTGLSDISHSLSDDFTRFFQKYINNFRVGRKTVKDKTFEYLQGLFMAERGKRNMERMTEKVEHSNYESLQHTISNSRWNTEELTKQIAQEAGVLLKGKGPVGLILDEKAHLKKGKKSAGVSRQYAGVIGKVDNCQVGVYSSICAEKYATIIDHRLYLSEEWANDKQRCKEAGIPPEKSRV